MRLDTSWTFRDIVPKVIQRLHAGRLAATRSGRDSISSDTELSCVFAYFGLLRMAIKPTTATNIRSDAYCCGVMLLHNRFRVLE